jgi:hypothetical protein
MSGTRPKFYRKVPVVVEAMQFTDNNSVQTLFTWIRPSQISVEAQFIDGVPVAFIFSPKGLDSIVVKPGDWIVKGITGEFKIYTPYTFQITYEEIL